eukprot:scaffold51459_cov62-Phaeocystis_antarctica.AAC.3
MSSRSRQHVRPRWPRARLTRGGGGGREFARGARQVGGTDEVGAVPDLVRVGVAELVGEHARAELLEAADAVGVGEHHELEHRAVVPRAIGPLVREQVADEVAEGGVVDVGGQPHQALDALAHAGGEEGAEVLAAHGEQGLGGAQPPPLHLEDGLALELRRLLLEQSAQVAAQGARLHGLRRQRRYGHEAEAGVGAVRHEQRRAHPRQHAHAQAAGRVEVLRREAGLAAASEGDGLALGADAADDVAVGIDAQPVGRGERGRLALPVGVPRGAAACDERRDAAVRVDAGQAVGVEGGDIDEGRPAPHRVHSDAVRRVELLVIHAERAARGEGADHAAARQHAHAVVAVVRHVQEVVHVYRHAARVEEGGVLCRAVAVRRGPVAGHRRHDALRRHRPDAVVATVCHVEQPQRIEGDAARVRKGGLGGHAIGEAACARAGQYAQPAALEHTDPMMARVGNVDPLSRRAHRHATRVEQTDNVRVIDRRRQRALEDLDGR